MSDHHFLSGGAEQRYFGFIRRATLVSTLILLSITAVFAQNDRDSDKDTTSSDLAELYDCSSYYTLANRCYSSGHSEEDKRLGIATLKNRDKIIHLIYVDSKRAGVLPETSQANMLSSFNKMIKDTKFSCQAVLALTSTLGSSCDRIIDSVPKQNYDKGQKSGSLSGFVSSFTG